MRTTSTVPDTSTLLSTRPGTNAGDPLADFTLNLATAQLKRRPNNALANAGIHPAIPPQTATPFHQHTTSAPAPDDAIPDIDDIAIVFALANPDDAIGAILSVSHILTTECSAVGFKLNFTNNKTEVTVNYSGPRAPPSALPSQEPVTHSLPPPRPTTRPRHTHLRFVSTHHHNTHARMRTTRRRRQQHNIRNDKLRRDLQPHADSLCTKLSVICLRYFPRRFNHAPIVLLNLCLPCICLLLRLRLRFRLSLRLCPLACLCLCLLSQYLWYGLGAIGVFGAGYTGITGACLPIGLVQSWIMCVCGCVCVCIRAELAHVPQLFDVNFFKPWFCP